MARKRDCGTGGWELSGDRVSSGKVNRGAISAQEQEGGGGGKKSSSPEQRFNVG